MPHRTQAAAARQRAPTEAPRRAAGQRRIAWQSLRTLRTDVESIREQLLDIQSRVCDMERALLALLRQSGAIR